MPTYRPAPDDGFTDLQRTRVYRREAPEERPSIGGTQIMRKREEGLFEGITLPQVIAGAAAAATSVLLASKIGIGGSVIGAAVSSVVTVVSSQLYRKFLTAGARKLKQGKDLLGTALPGSDDPERARRGAAASGYGMQAAGAPRRTTVIDRRGTATSRADGAWNARVAPVRLQARAEAERAAAQRKVIGFSVLIAAVAVIACACAILLGTAGEGIGTRPDPIFTQPTTPEEPAAEDTVADATGGTGDTSSADDAREPATPAEPTSPDGGSDTGTDDPATGGSANGTETGATDGDQDGADKPASPATDADGAGGTAGGNTTAGTAAGGTAAAAR